MPASCYYLIIHFHRYASYTKAHHALCGIHLQSCEALEGTPICDANAPADAWLSQVMAEAPTDPDGAGFVSDFSITWTADPQIPLGILGYIVVVRQVGLTATTAVLSRRVSGLKKLSTCSYLARLR